MLRLLSYTLFSLLLTSTLLCADATSDLKKGDAAYNKQDYAQAVSWYRKAADQGNTDAQTILGDMYNDGRVVVQDYAQAASWYRKAADQGYVLAQYNLGYMYYKGRGVAQDYAQAASWYHKAADQGDLPAYNNLGYMYKNGQGVAKDYAIAYALYNISATIDPSDENYATSDREILSQLMSPAQMVAGQALTHSMQTNGVSKAISSYQKKPATKK